MAQLLGAQDNLALELAVEVLYLTFRDLAFGYVQDDREQRLLAADHYQLAGIDAVARGAVLGSTEELQVVYHSRTPQLAPIFFIHGPVVSEEVVDALPDQILGREAKVPAEGLVDHDAAAFHVADHAGIGGEVEDVPE